jgi:hypothetical protein
MTHFQANAKLEFHIEQQRKRDERIDKRRYRKEVAKFIFAVACAGGAFYLLGSI